MGRTKLKSEPLKDPLPTSSSIDFSPTPAHNPDLNTTQGSRFFGWILPTWRTSEFTVLQTVGLDAAVVSAAGPRSKYS